MLSQLALAIRPGSPVGGGGWSRESGRAARSRAREHAGERLQLRLAGTCAFEQMAEDTVRTNEALESQAQKYARLRELGISSWSAIQRRPIDNSKVPEMKQSPGMIR